MSEDGSFEIRELTAWQGRCNACGEAGALEIDASFAEEWWQEHECPEGGHEQ